jgi:hypothetical protein
MPRTYTSFLKTKAGDGQTNFRGGENRTLRNVLGPGQVVRAENVRVTTDGLTLMHGYEAFSQVPGAGVGAFLDTGFVDEGYVGGAGGIVFLLPDSQVEPKNLWVFMDGGLGGAVAKVSATGEWGGVLSVNRDFPDWCGLVIGGTPAVPDAVLASNGDPALGVLNLASGAAVQWSASGMAFNGMAHWQNRLFALANDHLLYFTEGQHESFAVDPDDWQFLPLGDSSVRTRIAAVLNQTLYVIKERGIFRVDYIGAADELYQRVEVEPAVGCKWARGWTPILDGGAVAFYGLDNKVQVFDGQTVHTLTNEMNVETTLKEQAEAHAFDDVFLVWDEPAQVLTLGFVNQTESWGWDIHFKQGLPNMPWTFAHTKQVWSHRFRTARHTPLGTRSARRFFGSAEGEGVIGAIYAETPGVFTHAGLPYAATIEPAALDLSGYGSKNLYPVLREVAMDLSAGADVALTLKHCNEDGAYSAGKSVPVAAGTYRNVYAGVERSGYYPQVEITHTSGAGAWTLRGLRYAGYLKKGRRK